MRTMPGVVLKSLRKVLLAKVELRVATITFLLPLAALVFGAFMKDGAERSTPRGGALGRVAFGIGSMPVNLYRWFHAPGPPPVRGVSREQRFHGLAGLTFAVPPPPGVTWQERKGREADIWSLRATSLSRRRASLDRLRLFFSVILPVVVEIIDLNQRKVVHSWEPVSVDRLDRFNVLPDGSVLAGGGDGGRATFRMDACSNVVWEQRLQAHHSYERGVECLRTRPRTRSRISGRRGSSGSRPRVRA